MQTPLLAFWVHFKIYSAITKYFVWAITKMRLDILGTKILPWTGNVGALGWQGPEWLDRNRE